MGTFVEGMKKNYFISAILTIALGAVLVIWPDWSGRILCYLLGAALILMGGIQLIVCIRAERIGFYSKFSMLMNIILILLGVWVCIRPDTILVVMSNTFRAVAGSSAAVCSSRSKSFGFFNVAIKRVSACL